MKMQKISAQKPVSDEVMSDMFSDMISIAALRTDNGPPAFQAFAPSRKDMLMTSTSHTGDMKALRGQFSQALAAG